MASHKHANKHAPGKLVYVVEDDPGRRTDLVEVLESAGYRVTVVPTLEAAVTEGFWNGDPAKVVFVTPRASARN